ncbi:predicted protein [Aspergillus nidulans FGSC A4]|uniref:Uncharacterized protein n=1 Tax=Emericella nidulans (strain FGSC A4 / ATCC 38163 / CBS 112.46 / NRRL 194 / M139) TaxID=227321 RepID=Q5B1V6_EMENI|nr:hypothetical protein [Aspergillus nidulans FGSC A4]EAA62634.1 predicted protein [Aspergillus nidulans FGSC A4]CBF81843.1 TPA: conserved hypothetical protein [Aspergillus nidulans FGSC A4]|eukprot:XP_663078.1 predicted protein [Aspergillus nidulans FGSC A4]
MDRQTAEVPILLSGDFRTYKTITAVHSQTSLAPHQQDALEALSNNLADIAQQHLNAYIRGVSLTKASSAIAPAPTTDSLTPSPPPSRPPSGLAQSTYASVAQINSGKTAAIKKTGKPKPLKTETEAPPDTRLFTPLPFAPASALG